MRGILEYNSYRKQLLTDLLASFTYIPGTVVHCGYGSLDARIPADGAENPGPRPERLREQKRAFFAKASCLWRL